LSAVGKFEWPPRIGFESDGTTCLYIGWAKLILPTLFGVGAYDSGSTPHHMDGSSQHDTLAADSASIAQEYDRGSTSNLYPVYTCDSRPTFNVDGTPMMGGSMFDYNGNPYGSSDDW
jgi:hypothetical protein